jgi:phospholipase C
MSLQKIEHVVVLMLENRSFDSMLGWLYEHDAPANVIPKPELPGDLFRGLQPNQPKYNPANFLNPSATNPNFIVSPTRGAQGFTVPTVDPGEEYKHVYKQFYGYDLDPDFTPTEVTMQGFVADYAAVLKAQQFQAADPGFAKLVQMCMESFTPGQLPVLNQLAKHYAVCDDWFSSVPSQTNPNRAFLLCGTSKGLVNNGNLEDLNFYAALEGKLGMRVGDDRFNAKTIFDAFNDDDWAIFWQTSYLPKKLSKLLDVADKVQVVLSFLSHLPNLLTPITALINAAKPIIDAALKLVVLKDVIKPLASGDLSSSYTYRLFPETQKNPGNFKDIELFHALARKGLLPKFSYIEPRWSIAHTSNPSYMSLFMMQGNDYHPPSNLLIGEEFLKEVYTSLIANREAWEKTLLLITFDEPVGTFDHVDPSGRGAVEPPWGSGQPDTTNDLETPHFDFRRLGGRVPAILVSPYVQKATVFRSTDKNSSDKEGAIPYDHTSLIATITQWLGENTRLPASAYGSRAAAAPTFDEVLTLEEPRTDEWGLGFFEARNNGDVVQYGDSFRLKNQKGEYLTSSVLALKFSNTGVVISDSVMSVLADLQIAAYFPTLNSGESTKLSFLTQSPDPAAQINNNAEFLIVTREPGVGNHNILGAWDDSSDCYFYNEYIGSTGNADYAKKQRWTVQKLDNQNQPLHYGDRFYLVNSGYGQRLAADNTWFSRYDWLTTVKGGSDYWMLEPASSPETLNKKKPDITIGKQVWMAEDLDVSTYTDRTPIPEVTDPVIWSTLKTGAWCWYNNDPRYGKLYNWYAVAGIHDPDSLTDISKRKKLAPNGYHVPNVAEFATLSNTLGGDNVAGGKLKEAGTKHWKPDNTGATNSSGFTALGVGMRHYYTGNYFNEGYASQWWTSEPCADDPVEARVRELNFAATTFNTLKMFFTFCFQVRCLRD